MEKEEWVEIDQQLLLFADRPSFEVRFFRAHKQATGLVWIELLRPASPLRDSAGVSPDFAGLCAVRLFQ